MSDSVHILLAEDDLNLGYLLVENLTAKGFQVTLLQDGKQTLEAIDKHHYDLCIFDIMMPDVDGFALATVLTRHKNNTPFVFLTARSMETDKLRGFEIGAEDYITKPFSFKELYYRLMVALRRNRPNFHSHVFTDIIRMSNVTLKPSHRLLSINDMEKKLSQRESELLAVLMRNHGNYVTRSEILKQVWGNDDYFSAKSMDVYITRLRKLLKDNTALEIENLYGTGFRIRDVSASVDVSANGIA